MPPGFFFQIFISFQFKEFETQVAPFSVGRAAAELLACGVYSA